MSDPVPGDVPMDDPFRLRRFVAAQAPVIDTVLGELRAGRKRSHWMWFIFPQWANLGSSEMSRRYAIASIGEAEAYLAHPLLGARLRECSQRVLDVQGRTVGEIFGAPDDQKFWSSMTLFALVDATPGVFRECLDTCFAGALDRRSADLVEAARRRR
jgi:uncharacterized protein (DUF1810 family)